VLETLWQAGHAAYVVGGGVRDYLLGRRETDWDVTTDARPERIIELFPDGRYENRFGTVTIGGHGSDRGGSTGGVEATTFRRDHVYGDHRRPDSVTFTDDVEEDLLRRDFTVNAIAWGRGGDSERNPPATTWVDPSGGLGDLDARLLRAVGDPLRRFDEDSLRLMRAARLAAQLGFEIESETRTAMVASASLVAWISSERVGGELRRMLAADPPSVGLRILAETGLLPGVFPELAAQSGLPQAKIEGHDLWDHTLATVDAAAAIAPEHPRLRLAALVHDIGKPQTMSEGRFIGHDVEGARLAEAFLGRLAFPRAEVEHIARLVRHHMFHYTPAWSNAALRRFLRRVGPDLVDNLLLLRQADNVGSGKPADSGHLAELKSRVDAELAAGVPLNLRQLAVNGRDVADAAGIPPGPEIGVLLERLLDSVVADPSRNVRDVLLADARAWAGVSRGADEGTAPAAG
jgi:putative nucleotidyltransferase with HDIG domain